jgi:hypothetical protein
LLQQSFVQLSGDRSLSARGGHPVWLFLEQPIVVLRLRRDDLKHIPMLDNLAILIESKNVDSCVVFVSRPLLVTMENNVIIFCYRSFEVGLLARIFRAHPFKILDKRFLAVRDMRVVLDVLISRVPLDGLTRLTLIEHQIIERLRVALVLLQLVAQFNFSELLQSSTRDSSSGGFGSTPADSKSRIVAFEQLELGSLRPS